MSKSDYIFKLTPNNRELIINTDVLINGYKDVSYPIPFKSTSTLSYVQDPDTFKFIDSSDIDYIKGVYPIKMEIECDFPYLPFYGENKAKHIEPDGYTDDYDASLYRIRYNYIMKNSDNTYDYLVKPIFDVSSNDNYDVITFSRNSSYNHKDNDGNNYYDAGYTIKVKIYWSDNGHHAKSDDNINLTLYISKLNRSVGHSFGVDGKTIYLYTTNNVLSEIYKDGNDYTNFIGIFDNFTYNDREVGLITVECEYTESFTKLSVVGSTSVTVNQYKHMGQKKGYAYVYYKDCIPLEIWSPSITPLYTKSVDDEANVKVDSGSNTEYFGFCVDGNLNVDIKKYGDRYLYYSGAYDTSFIVDTSVKTKTYINDSSIDKSNAELNKLKLVSIDISNFCVNAFNDLIESGTFSYDVLDTRVFSSEDVSVFKDRWSICDKVKNYNDLNNPSEGYSYLYQLSDNENYSDISTHNNLDISIDNSTNSIDCSGFLFALYAKYWLNNNNYLQMINDSSNQWNTDNRDIVDYKESSMFKTDMYKPVLNYKIISDTDGNAIQYKYCINSLIDSSKVQVPRYGVYPIYAGSVPIYTDVYDFDNDNPNMLPYVYTLMDGSTFIYKDTSTHKLKINLDELNDYVSNITEVSSEYVSSKVLFPSIFSDESIEIDTYNSSFQKYGINYKSSNLEEANKEYNYTLSLSSTNNDLLKYIKVNGVDVSLLTNKTIKSYVNPGIFTISIDEKYPYDTSGIIDIMLNSTVCSLLITNDENEKHLETYENEGHTVNTNHQSSMLLRANPKLSGNIKLVVDTDYNLYLDTFKANSVLNNQIYRKYPISTEGNYPRDVKTVFKSLPANNLFAVSENSLKAHKVYTDFNNQYETMYEYGAETNTDNLYSENMKILAPLHIGDDVPEFFTIFRYNDIFNKETYNGTPIDDNDKFETLLKDSSVVKTYDLRKHTSIGQYLINYRNMLSNYGECYLQFIEQDNDEHSESYRQGNNIWKGISVQRGILVDQSETTYFGSKILNSSVNNKQELFNNYIIQGFERHNLLYPNIINLEFMFNDNDMEEYSMHRYFGLYLTRNEFIKYSQVLSENNILTKYDLDGNVYKGDVNIFNEIFIGSTYKDRLFYAITNDFADRIYSELDLTDFFNKYVKNTPEYNLISLDADNIDFESDDKSFITLHFSKPLVYGEHLKFIALNYTTDNTYINVGSVKDNESNELSTENIVYEIIASNDERLRNTDNCISPYINTLKCRYSENTYFYRLSFYSQDKDYPEVTATLKDQIDRIKACITKFNTFISVGSSNNNSISIISKFENMYVQHIDAHSFDDFDYDYVHFSGIGQTIYTTNQNYNNSLTVLTKDFDIIERIEKYDQSDDQKYDWIKTKGNSKDSTWYSYIESEDEKNIKIDSISYFNSYMEYKMHALSNKSNYFDNYYTAFSNYCFETLGWRYNTVVKFQLIKNITNPYVIYTDITNIVKEVKKPLIVNTDTLYDVLNQYNINTGYIKNYIINPDICREYADQQEYIYETYELSTITNPYDVNYSMIYAKNESLLPNKKIHLYKSKSAAVAVMGITNIKDIDTTIDLERTLHRETNLNINVPAGETILADESDYRIQHGVMYEIVSGKFGIDGTTNKVSQGCKFIVVLDTVYIQGMIKQTTVQQTNVKFVALTDVVYKICDKQIYQDYNYDSVIPTLHSDNYFVDPDNTDNTELVYPIVPLTHCLWKSNGQYYDNNSILDVSTLNFNYEVKGNFTENTYNAADYDFNQYVTNKVDNILYIDGNVYTYKDCILNKRIKNSIKKLLIDNTNIETASVYYNSNIQSLEFIFAGIKYNIKLNSKVVNSYIHLDEYSDFEAFVIIDYDLTKRNELYISLQERFILLVNHQFYIDYSHEAESNIKCVINNKFKSYADYSAFAAPYCIDFSSSGVLNKEFASYKKSSSDLHKKLMSSIDEHNLWSSVFVQYDIPTFDKTDGNKSQFISSMMETISEYNDYVTFGAVPYGVGLMDTDNNYSVSKLDINRDDVKSTHSDSHSFIITKADGEYNHQAYTLLDNINSRLRKLLNTDYENINLNKLDLNFDREITINEDKLAKRYDINVNSNDNDNLITVDNLSTILKSPVFSVFKGIVEDAQKKYSNVMISKTYLNKLQTYIEKIIALESPKEKLERYVSTFTDEIDIYVIPTDSEYKLIRNRESYNPLMFTLSIPNHIKFNYGWFTPNENNMVDFYVNDNSLQNIIKVDLLQANTRFKSVNTIKNYTGNKVFEDTQLQTLNHNYFLVDERSLLSSTWDTNYYRLYTSENDYNIKEGQLTGIDDKAFFGSHCMVLYNSYIELKQWNYNNANDIYTTSYVDSQHNLKSSNTQSLSIQINLTSAIYNHFVNNEAFKENWSYFKDSQNTGMKNYVNNTLSTFYNMNSNIEVTIYAIDTDVNSVINIEDEKPANIKDYYIYENYSTSFKKNNGLNWLNIIIDKTTGMNIYLTVKIYRK